MNIQKDVIGIVGGMGSYATVNIFKRILDAFPAEKEWERPHIIVDNICHLPSRSRAILYGERYDEVIDGIASSIKYLLNAGANIIVLSSNTSHILLDEIYKKVPESRGVIINFMETLANKIITENLKEILLIGTEATIEHNLYASYLSNVHIKTANEEETKEINTYIEAVKKNKITEHDITGFRQFILNHNEMPIILGCTELPVLFEYIKNDISVKVYDPIDTVIEFIKKF